jgi:hypothetical protein
LVSIGFGITVALHERGEGDGATYSASWREKGWTFVVSPTVGTGNPLGTIRMLAKEALTLRFPSPEGTAVFAFGPDAPSLAVFRVGPAWYSVYANGFEAASFAAAMAP